MPTGRQAEHWASGGRDGRWWQPRCSPPPTVTSVASHAENHLHAESHTWQKRKKTTCLYVSNRGHPRRTPHAPLLGRVEARCTERGRTLQEAASHTQYRAVRAAQPPRDLRILFHSLPGL